MSSNKDLKEIIQDHYDKVEVGIKEAWRNDMSDRLDAFNKRKRRWIIFFFLISTILIFLGLTFGMNFFSGKLEGSNHSASITSQGQAILTNQSVQNEPKPRGEKYEKSNINSNDCNISNEKRFSNNFPLERRTDKCQEYRLAQENTASSRKSIINEFISNRKVISSINQEQQGKNALSNFIPPSTTDSTQEDRKITSPLPNIEVSMGDTKKAAKSDSLHATERLKDDNNINRKTTLHANNEKDSLKTEANKLILLDRIEKPLLPQNDKFLESLKMIPSLWEIGVLSGMSFDVRTFNSSTSTPYYDERKINEQVNWGWSTSIEIARKVGCYQLISGISYQNISETINYDVVAFESSEVIETYIDNSYWEYDSVMQLGVWYYFDSVYVQDFDTNYQTVTTSVNDSSGLPANGRNSFQYVQVPLRFGFPIYHFPKLHFDGYIGGSIGVLAKKRGNYLVNSGGVSAAEAKKVTFNSYFSIRMKYEIVENIDFGVESYVRINHGNHSLIEGVKRRYTSFGMNVGLFYSL
ncbi:MAG: hypothetical protein HRT57_10035 [Crocinitomicaceae bacterium]|nr:hypothetical protein [Crocinitomicaceae bacterium]